MKNDATPRPKPALANAPRPRTKPPGVRREELLDAAEHLFVKQGVTRTSIDDIVAAAGVAKGTFYLYFESREHLLVSLQQRFVTGLCQHFQAAMDRRHAGDWEGRLRAWAGAGVSGYLDRIALHDVVFHEFRPGDPRARHENPVVTQLAELLRQGTRAGAWSIGNPHLTAVMLFHALHGAVDEAIATPEPIHRKRLAAALKAFFCRAVGLE